ncbi:hypothetical protein EMQ25_07910 [Arsenicitalea aurantiaca]|uniref:Carboxypeptidase regulatory-like domain-containing protein n=1 Tax=Arsenicitalea aurantiaca TaxID=1783274 RepID=A0A433XG53_9HYPH|nr:hypothetical protein [Arsenicitalea aurantiaca]RUT33040.1 hypothetical protein EMQ25_07910 [Arsenicitalea aurantiaca]
MSSRTCFAVASALMLALATPAAFAQSEAPVPMPRPADRMPDPSEVPGPADSPEAPATAESPAPIAADAATTASEAVNAFAAEVQPVTLTALITEGGASIPEGLVWRIFDTRTDNSGQLALAAKSEDATARVSLAPGEYVVHVAYGRAQASDRLSVEPGGGTKSVILDAGALRLNAAITGDVPIPINQLRFDVYTQGNEIDRVLVAENLSSSDIVTLNAGTYHIVSRFGDINAVVRADLRVEPGQMTEATLYHRAAQISFRLVTETGGEAIADVEWTVQNESGQTIFSEISAFPATVLAEGDYIVLAKQGDTVFNREFEVAPGPAREIEVLTEVY